MLLEGIRVIEWSDRLAASFCARVLADLGADVIKIEPPGQGDALRQIGPLLAENPHGAGSALFAYANHGKRVITLDPTHPAGAKLLLRLLEHAALLASAFCPDWTIATIMEQVLVEGSRRYVIRFLLGEDAYVATVPESLIDGTV